MPRHAEKQSLRYSDNIVVVADYSVLFKMHSKKVLVGRAKDSKFGKNNCFIKSLTSVIAASFFSFPF